MKFSKEFFDGEYREDFYIEPMMKKYWASQLEVLSRISDICERHGIKWFALWGSLLGAVRHKGFVPWDDDIDIAMLREDFDAFFEVAKQELPEEYKVINIYNEPEWDIGIGRVTNYDGIIVTKERLQEYHGCPFAVGIDIFPYDYIPDDEATRSYQNNMLKLITTVTDSIKGAMDGNPDSKAYLELDNIKIGLDYLENIFGFQFNREVHIINQLDCLYDQVFSTMGNPDSRFITCYMEKNKRESKNRTFMLPSFWMKEIIKLPFENTTINVPKYYEAVLSVCYGKNFMTPVKAGVAGHEYPCYKSQISFMNERGLDKVYDDVMSLYTEEYSEEKYIAPVNGFLHELCGKENNEYQNDRNLDIIEKKRILYCVSSMDVYSSENEFVDKIKDTLLFFKEKKDTVDIVFSIDPLSFDLVYFEDDLLCDRLDAIISSEIEDGWFEFIQYDDVPKIVQKCDAYYGSGCMYTKYFTLQKKPVMVHDLSIKNN